MFAPVAAHAQYPGDQVTIVVPFTAGGATDSYARFIGEGLSEKWGVPVIVENKPGAGSTIGNAAVAHAQPDGRTLLFTTPAITTSAAINPNLPYDSFSDIQPVAMVSKGPFVLTLGPKNEVATVADLQAQEGLFYGAVGAGSSTHFVSAMLISALGLSAEPVFYKGGSDAIVDLIGGRIDLYLGTVSQSAGNVQSGQIRGLAVTSPERSSALPDVPTLVELGVDLNIEQWWGLFTTGGTPPEIVAQINADVNSVLATDEAKIFFEKLGAQPVMESSDFFADAYAADIERWKQVAVDNNITWE